MVPWLDAARVGIPVGPSGCHITLKAEGKEEEARKSPVSLRSGTIRSHPRSPKRPASRWPDSHRRGVWEAVRPQEGWDAGDKGDVHTPDFPNPFALEGAAFSFLWV